MSQPLKQPISRGLSLMQSLVAKDLAEVDRVILEGTQERAPLIGQLTQHLIASGGKRLRPALTLLTARICGYQGARHIRLAAAVEYIHTATLLHDDVVDESHLRRGIATANDLWGNKASVLVGDFILSQSFRLVVADGSLPILQLLSDATGVLAEGELLQLETMQNLATTEESYLKVIAAKTAELFAVASQIGGILGEKPEEAAALRQFGRNLGIAFQMVDDALDYSAKQSELGKAIGDDFREGKITLPVILALRQASDEERQFWTRVLETHDQQEGDLAQAMALILKHGCLQATFSKAADFCEAARKSLAIFPDSEEKQALLDAVTFCLERTY